MRTGNDFWERLPSLVLSVGSLLLVPSVIEAFDGPFGPWNDKDVGDTGLFGSAGCTNGVFTITGSGADICCTADAFNYTYRTWTADCGFIVCLAQVVGTNALARGGIMFRATLDPASPYAFVQFRTGQETVFQTRDTAGQNTWIDGTWTGTPQWLKLVRLGNTFFGYDSTNGTNWNLTGSTKIHMPSTFLVGLAVTSHSYGSACTATFDNLQVAATPAAPTNLRALRAFDSIHLSWRDNSTNEQGFRIEFRQQWGGVDYYYYRQVGPNVTNYVDSWLPGAFWRVAATGILDSAYSDVATPISGILDPVPAPWRATDIGAVGQPGGENFRDGVFSIAGSGSDIGGVADQFHFVYMPFSGDGEIAGPQPGAPGDYFGNSAGKAGIMFRQSLDPGSANAFFYSHPGGNGYGTQMRPSMGAATQSNAVPPSMYIHTYWVRLTRNGNTFTVYAAGAYDSPGQWFTLDSWQVPMTDPIYVGMAVSSLDDYFLQTSEFVSLRFAPLRGTLTAIRESNNAIQLTLTGMINHAYGIDGSTNLIDWVRLATQMNTNGVITLTETTGLHQRFYRPVLVQ